MRNAAKTDSFGTYLETIQVSGTTASGIGYREAVSSPVAIHLLALVAQSESKPVSIPRLLESSKIEFRVFASALDWLVSRGFVEVKKTGTEETVNLTDRGTIELQGYGINPLP
jgi:predicted transcriptional regulator